MSTTVPCLIHAIVEHKNGHFMWPSVFAIDQSSIAEPSSCNCARSMHDDSCVKSINSRKMTQKK